MPPTAPWALRSLLLALLLAHAADAAAEDLAARAKAAGIRLDDGWTTVREPAGEPPVIGTRTIFRGTVSEAGDVDRLTLRLTQDAVITLLIICDEGVALSTVKAKTLVKSVRLARRLPSGVVRLAASKGDHAIEITGHRHTQVGDYHLFVQLEHDEPGWESERLAARHVIPIKLGERRRGVNSFHGDWDSYEVEVSKRTLCRLTVRRLPVNGTIQPLSCHVRVGQHADNFGYRFDLAAHDTLYFYPVLEPGKHPLVVAQMSGQLGAAYEVLLEPFSVGVTPRDEAAGRAAVAAGLRWLLDSHPDDKPRRKHRVAHTALSLMALVEHRPKQGARDARREAAIAAHITTLRKGLKALKDVAWDGAGLQQFSVYTYDVAIATLALADAAGSGYEAAKAPAREGVRWLLAAQIGPDRPEAWGDPVKTGATLGGWRYGGKSKSADISVVGWCMIALYAADVAGIEVRGLQPAVERGLAYVGRCGDSTTGFYYQHQRRGRPTSIQQSIGALLFLLLDEEHPGLQPCLRDLDKHLCASTQVGHGHDSPCYYFYYVTRVNYLRGGYAWESWRQITLRQLCHRQRKDGSWAALRHEEGEGERFTTAMMVMILRLCLNQPPAYLQRDVSGF